MIEKKRLGMAAAVLAAAVLAACGGGGSDAPTADRVFVDTYAANLERTNTAGGMTAVASSFDAQYLDAGITQAQVNAALNGEAAASSNPDYSGFPQLSLTNATVGNCDSQNICTLTGTLTNDDADSTSVPVSVRVINRNGTYLLYGDQQVA